MFNDFFEIVSSISVSGILSICGMILIFIGSMFVGKVLSYVRILMTKQDKEREQSAIHLKNISEILKLMLLESRGKGNGKKDRTD